MKVNWTKLTFVISMAIIIVGVGALTRGVLW